MAILNTVHLKGVVLRLRQFNSVARCTVAGDDENGNPFYVDCMAMGDVAKELLAFGKKAGDKPFAIESDGAFWLSSFTRKSGERAEEVVVNLHTVKPIKGKLALTAADSKGQKRLAKGQNSATFSGEVMYQADPGQYGVKVVVKQVEGKLYRFLRIRVKSASEAVFPGQTIEAEGRIARLKRKASGEGFDNIVQGIVVDGDTFKVSGAPKENASSKGKKTTASQKPAAVAAASNDEEVPAEDLPF